MTITTVFLDAGGVLVMPNWERISRMLACRGLVVPAARLSDADQHIKHELDLQVVPSSLAGRDIEQEFFERVFAHAGAVINDAALAAIAEAREYHVARNLWEVVPAEVPSALARLRAQGLRLAVVSNANGTLKQAFERLGLAALVDVVVDSFEEGVSKPDRRLFEIALERIGGDRSTTIHVGDVFQSDVIGALNAGLRAVLLDRLDLYAGWSCPRVRSLSELADRLSVGSLGA